MAAAVEVLEEAAGREDARSQNSRFTGQATKGLLYERAYDVASTGLLLPGDGFPRAHQAYQQRVAAPLPTAQQHATRGEAHTSPTALVL
jgi:hypothetical protein